MRHGEIGRYEIVADRQDVRSPNKDQVILRRIDQIVQLTLAALVAETVIRQLESMRHQGRQLLRIGARWIGQVTSRITTRCSWNGIEQGMDTRLAQTRDLQLTGNLGRGLDGESIIGHRCHREGIREVLQIVFDGLQHTHRGGLILYLITWVTALETLVDEPFAPLGCIETDTLLLDKLRHFRLEMSVTDSKVVHQPLSFGRMYEVQRSDDIRELTRTGIAHIAVTHIDIGQDRVIGGAYLDGVDSRLLSVTDLAEDTGGIVSRTEGRLQRYQLFGLFNQCSCHRGRDLFTAIHVGGLLGHCWQRPEQSLDD